MTILEMATEPSASVSPNLWQVIFVGALAGAVVAPILALVLMAILHRLFPGQVPGRRINGVAMTLGCFGVLIATGVVIVLLIAFRASHVPPRVNAETARDEEANADTQTEPRTPSGMGVSEDLTLGLVDATHGTKDAEVYLNLVRRMAELKASGLDPQHPERMRVEASLDEFRARRVDPESKISEQLTDGMADTRLQDQDHDPAQAPLRIRLLKSGGFAFDGEEWRQDQLAEALGDRGTRVVLVAEKEMPMATIMEWINALKELGFEVSFAVAADEE